MPMFNQRETAVSAAEKLKVFAQPQRLMILSCLLRGERNVGEIDELTGIGQPALSQQLAALRKADLVTTRREGQLIWYSLANEDVALCVRNMEAIFGGEGEISEFAAPPPGQPSSATRKQPRSGTAQFARLL